MSTKKDINILVSVRLMTYNHSDFIIEALESIDEQQTNFKFELVIGDDFSTDDNLKKINSFVFTNKNIFVTILKREKGDNYDIERKKRGRFYNFSNILENCKGKYIALLDGDDYWTDTQKLQYQVDFLEQSQNNIVGCFHNSVCVDENSKTIEEQYFSKTSKSYYSQEECLKVLQSSYSTGSLVFRSSAIQNQLSEFLKVGSDFILEMLITNHGDLYYMPKNMSSYRIHSGGIWQGNSTIKNLQTVLQRFTYLYNNPSFNKKYNNYLWVSILKHFDKIIQLSKNEKEKKEIKKQKLSFLNFSETRTYWYLIKNIRLPFHYKLKKIKSKLNKL